MQFLLLKAVKQETPSPPPKGLHKLRLFLSFKTKKAATSPATKESSPQPNIDKNTLVEAPARQSTSAGTILVDVFALPPAPTSTPLDDLIRLLQETPANATTSVPSSTSSSVVEQQ